MKKLIAIIILVFATVVGAQEDTGITVTCPTGTELLNGTEVITNLRSGFLYTVTAIGMDGYDPVLAVADNNGVFRCSNNAPNAANYRARLPSTGLVPASSQSAQLEIIPEGGGIQNLAIIVGSSAGTGGEVVLIFEGLSLTEDEEIGDAFTLNLTENIAAAPIDTAVYMFALDDNLDPLLQITDDTGSPLIECDDAGSGDFCDDPDTSNLSASFVTTRSGASTPGSSFNAMLNLRTQELRELDFTEEFFVNLMMTSYTRQSNGDYVVVFHIGISGDTANGAFEFKPTINVNCLNGISIINGVEVVVNLRPSFVYTATALGIDGFDPVMAILEDGVVQQCADDSSSAVNFSADLPTTGAIRTSNFNPQIQFTHEGDEFENISIVVGGLDGAEGEFLLVFEGLVVTEADGEGDPVQVRITPNMVNAGVPLAIYMLAQDDDLDPLMRWVGEDGVLIARCDDGGSEQFCQEGTSPLDDAVISPGSRRETVQSKTNAMLLIPLESYYDMVYETSVYLRFLMASFSDSEGDYVVGIHAGTGDPAPRSNAKLR